MTNSKLTKSIVAVIAIALTLPGVVSAQKDGTHNLVTKETAKSFEEKSYSPYVGRNFPTRPLWGDTHLHTSASIDAFGYGNTGLGAEEAYRFARGEEVRSSSGQRVRLSRPLDWLVIADHGEVSGVGPRRPGVIPRRLLRTGIPDGNPVRIDFRGRV